MEIPNWIKKRSTANLRATLRSNIQIMDGIQSEVKQFWNQF